MLQPDQPCGAEGEPTACRGITRDQIMGVLHTMAQELPAATPRMLQWASKNACDVRVLSDCNAVVIGHVLKGTLSPQLLVVVHAWLGFLDMPSSAPSASARLSALPSCYSVTASPQVECRLDSQSLQAMHPALGPKVIPEPAQALNGQCHLQ